MSNTDSKLKELLDKREEENAKFRRKKKIYLFSFFSFLFVFVILFFFYKIFIQKPNIKIKTNKELVDNVVYLPVFDYYKLYSTKNKETTIDSYSKILNVKINKKYIVQLGIFKEFSNVRREKERLEKLGYKIYYEKNGDYYKLRFNVEFDNREKAESFAKNLMKINVINDYWIRLK
ncbi:SPOR domain-containing protein [Hypnocyclicus thermotrophus]|nr:SPOR domain-containing protein [Hypnocyclicus thermotrophus]